jgi:hypothetical protein
MLVFRLIDARLIDARPARGVSKLSLQAINAAWLVCWRNESLQ